MVEERSTAAFGNLRSVRRHERAQALHRGSADASNPAQVVDAGEGAVRLSIFDDGRRRLRANMGQRLQAVDAGLVDLASQIADRPADRRGVNLHEARENVSAINA